MTTPLSRRDAIAVAIYNGFLSYPNSSTPAESLRLAAVEEADALIAELDRTAPRNAPKPSVTSGANDLGTVWLRSGGGPTRVYDHKADAGPGAILVRLVPVEEPPPQRLGENTVETQYPLAGPLASAYPEG